MSLPSTGFESRNHQAPWTTFAEEAAYIDALLDEVPSIEKQVIGQGSTGLDLNLFKIGSGPRRMFILAQIHSNEVSGRDALLSCLRDWATDTSSTMQDYLQDATLLILPTSRPDSQTTRNNANGVNLNRDHIAVTQSETRAIQSVITEYRPDVVVDVHEGRNISNDCATSKVLNPNVQQDLLALSDDLERAVRGAVEGAGFTWEPYQNHNIIGPEYTHNCGGLRHAVGLLLESRRVDDNSWNTRGRFDSQVTALNAVIAWHRTHMAEVADASAESRVAANAGRARYEFVVGTDTSGPSAEPAPTFYRLPQGVTPAVSRVSGVFGFQVSSSGTATEVKAVGDEQNIIHYLFHPESTEAVQIGVPIWRLLPGELIPGGASRYQLFMSQSGSVSPVRVP